MPCLMCLWTLTWNFLIKWLCFLANSLNFLHMYFLQEMSKFIEPSPAKQRSGGLHTVTVPLILYTDDTNGNRSKKWNKFDCWCLLLAGLPRHLNSQMQNIHFIACSNKADCLDMAPTIVDDLKLLEDGLVMFDSMLGKDVFVAAPVLAILADNPRHSVLLSHLGSRANLYCRMCMVSFNVLHVRTPAPQ